MIFETKDYRGFQTRITIKPQLGDTIDSLIDVCSGDLDRVETIKFVECCGCPAITWKEFKMWRLGFNTAVALAEQIAKQKFPHGGQS